VELDHVLLAACDLERDAAFLEETYGLESAIGGRHPSWGTANRIVPLGTSYIELAAVVDEHVAGASVFGRWVASAAHAARLRPFGWAVRPRDLDGTAARLGLTVVSGSRTTPSGASVDWRTCGLEQAARDSRFPFFLEWRDPASFPGATSDPAGTIERIEVASDPGELADWLGPNSLPVDAHPGGTRVTRVTLRGPRGRIVLEGDATA
jgi:glyoxalase-like protein